MTHLASYHETFQLAAVSPAVTPPPHIRGLMSLDSGALSTNVPVVRADEEIVNVYVTVNCV